MMKQVREQRMENRNDYAVIMSEFILFLEQVLLLNDIVVETELTIYAKREINEGYYSNIYEYHLKNIENRNSFIRLYFPSSDEILIDDISTNDLIKHDIVVGYQQIIDELIQNVDHQIDSNRKNLIVDYMVMLLTEVALTGRTLDEDVYHELYRLCDKMKETLDNPSFHYYVPVKEKSLN